MTQTEEIRDLEIVSLAKGGDGVAFLDGLTVFVPYSCPGDSVRVEFTGRGKGFANARIREILTPSPDRVEPECPLAGICGGCSLQHIAYVKQLEWKRGVVRDAFRKIPELHVDDAELRFSEPYGARSRMRFDFSVSGRAGLHVRESSEIVEIPSCPAAVPSINVFLAGDAPSKPERASFGSMFKTSDGFHVFGTDDRVWVEGRDLDARVTVCGKDIVFPVSGFFQTNLPLLPELVNRVTSGIGKVSVCDLYSGVGLFAAFAADTAQAITCVEEYRPAAEYIRKNVTHPKLTVCPHSVERWLKEGSGRKFDIVIADPPRTGLSTEIKKFLTTTKIPEIRYVSCDPATMARDVGELLHAGYGIASFELFDFYPQTTHIESYMVLRRS